MCEYFDETSVYGKCSSHHRIADRTYKLCQNPRSTGTYRYCTDSTPSLTCIFGSTKRPGERPVCAGSRLEVVIKVGELLHGTRSPSDSQIFIAYYPSQSVKGSELSLTEELRDGTAILGLYYQVIIRRDALAG